ncbi:TetR-like C-terminal domain-containing protein [Kribbella koreensis]|uniref:TetR-like C-terminal domain-containing protein n=1 Tax=Kribbella koreensis TaxID=57909 RepID=A0ABN1RLW4_9ACTN
MPRVGMTADRLTQAAAELADEIGFANVTVSALARHFGVKDASLYSHIKNAKDLRARVAAQALTELADQVATNMAGRSGKDALAAFANSYRDYATQHPGRYAAMQQDLDADGPAAAPARRHADLTRSILHAYNLTPEAQIDAIRLLGATLHGYITLELQGSYRHTPRPSQSSWQVALTALHTLLTNWPED